MPLRLAGERDTINGLDTLGWLRTIDASSQATPALTLTPGTGAGLRIDKNNVVALEQRAPDATYSTALKLTSGNVWELGGGKDLKVTGALDAQGAIKNTSAVNGGSVAIGDSLIVAGNLEVYDTLGGSFKIGFQAPDQCLVFVKRATHIADAAINDGEAETYVYSSGGTRQLVVKLKESGVVYTGTVALA